MSLHQHLRRISTSLPRSVLFYLGTTALLALVLHQVAIVGDFRIDDAYISFSFSNNLAAGNGPVFSHGVRVEGYSNFLWVVLVALGSLVHSGTDPYPVARVLAFAFLLIGVVCTYRLARRHASRWAAFFALALLLSSTDVVRATLSGLETVPYMAALVFGWYVYLREPAHARRYSLLAFLPAALLRINGFIPMAVVIGFEAASSVLERRLSVRVFLRWVAPAVLMYGLYFLWRYDYYGLLFPSTYYAKEFVALNAPTRGFDQAYGFLRESAGLAVIPLMFLPLVLQPRREGWGLMAAVVVQVAYSIYVGGDWMPFNRFFLPILPLACVLAAWGAQIAMTSVRSAPWLARAGVGSLLAGVLGLVAVYGYSGTVETEEERRKLAEAQHVLRHTHENLLGVTDLVQHVIRQPGEKLVTDYAGVFGVFTDAKVIDMWGLCTEEIALRGGVEGINPIFGKECAECYVDIEPDYFHVVVPLARPRHAFRNVDQVIAQMFQGRAIDRHLDLRRRYAVGRVVDVTAPDRAFWFLERRRPNMPLTPRNPTPGTCVDYPFERRPSFAGARPDACG